ncbi:unnamed protein product, partial [Ectocarpus fasciculatus]
LGYVFVKHTDFVVTLLPKYYDGYFVQALYPRDKTNTGSIGKMPFISRVVPTKLTMENLSQIFSPNGYPVHVKNIMQVDQDKVIGIMAKRNKGRNMRMISFENWTTPHISPSCAMLKASVLASFDEYAESHLFSEVANNHSYLYAGFESITDPETIEEFTGLDIKTLGDYRQNNLFTSNFPKEILTAAMHCAPIDSLTLQLLGTKTWYFVSPEDLAKVQNIPMPTAFNLPMTDDELLAAFSNIHIVKQGPGDAMYFGPHWCHAVSTSPGPNLMMNMRYNNIPLVKKGPLSLTAKLMIRYMTRTMGGLPQDNTIHFPVIYDDLNQYYDKCGESEGMKQLFQSVIEMEH